MNSPERTWTAASEAPIVARCRNPDTPVDELASMLADFPGEVLRNPSFKLAMVADRSMIRGMPLHKQAFLALDAEYRELAMSVADAPEIEGFVQFCERYAGPGFRFQHTNPTRQIAYKPLMTDAPEAPSEELISAVRFASALASVVTSPYESKRLEVWARCPADGDYYNDGHLQREAPLGGGTEKPSYEGIPKPVRAVIASAFVSDSLFELEARNGGGEVDVSLLARAYHVALEMVKSQKGNDLHKCFSVDGSTPSNSETARLKKAVKELEALVPRRSRDELVLVIDDLHGYVLDVGITVCSVSADDALDDGRIADFRKLIAEECLEDVADRLALEDAERLEANEPAISDALRELKDCIDSQFRGREFEYQIAAFREGRLVAFYGDKLEVEPIQSKAWIRTSRPANQH
jgi:hypothetical protein